jgi:lambda family phage portal protein
MIGRTLDSIISVFSPEKALRRATARQLYAGQRQYAAAKESRTQYGWRPASGATVNDEIRTSSIYVRARIRQLVRDFAPFGRAVQILEDLVVGPEGIRWQSRHETKSSELESVWRAWGEQADIAGKLHWIEMQGLAQRQLCECGEYIFVKHKTQGARIPFQLQAVEPDRLTGETVRVAPEYRVDQGVEFDPVTGRVIAYHIDNGEYNRNILRIDASRVLHGFHCLRPGQLRGISPFTAGVLLANDLAEYMDTEIDAAKTAAKYLAFVKTSDAAGFQDARGLTTEDGKKIDDMENAIVEYLRPGEEITLANNPRPGNGWEPFVRFILRMLSISTGVPYDTLSGDYSQSNYSSSRLARNDLNIILRPKQSRQVRHLNQPVLREVIEAAVLSRQLQISDYHQRPYLYHEGSWIAPGLAPVDPLKESKADRDQMDGLLRSPQEICAARGRDYEEVLDEIAKARSMQDARNLTPADVSTATASNPATITGDDDE